MKKRQLTALIFAVLFVAATFSSCRYKDSEKSSGTETNIEDREPEVFSEQNIFKENDVTVIATSLTDEKDSLSVGFDITNSTFNYISLFFDFVSADGVMIPFESGGSVEANRNGTGYLTIKKAELEKLGITSVGELSFTLKIIDANTSVPITAKSGITVTLPYEAKRDEGAVNGAVVYDKSRVRITVIKIVYNEEKDSLDFLTYIENNTSKDLNIGSSKFLINGEENRFPRLSCDIASKKVAYHTLSVSFESLKEIGINNISAVNQITFDLVGNDDNMENVFRTGDMTVDFE